MVGHYSLFMGSMFIQDNDDLIGYSSAKLGKNRSRRYAMAAEIILDVKLLA